MRIGSRESVWSEYGAARAARLRDVEPSSPSSSEAAKSAPPAQASDQSVTVKLVGQREVDPPPFWVRASAGDDSAAPDSPEKAAKAAADEAAGKTEEPAGRGPGRKLTKEQTAEVQELRQRDTEVRAHEAAHMAAAGSMGGGASFEYQVGPDGRNYAVGGEVPVRTAPAQTPEDAIRNAAQLRAAALAPAEPSGQDRAVAAEAAAMEAAARAEIAARRTEESIRTAEVAMASSRSDEPPPPVGEDGEAAAVTKSVMKQVQSNEGSERDRVLQELESEQRFQRGGWRHLHTESRCASCSSAVAAYR